MHWQIKIQTVSGTRSPKLPGKDFTTREVWEQLATDCYSWGAFPLPSVWVLSLMFNSNCCPIYNLIKWHHHPTIHEKHRTNLLKNMDKTNTSTRRNSFGYLSHLFRIIWFILPWKWILSVSISRMKTYSRCFQNNKHRLIFFSNSWLMFTYLSAYHH